MSTKSKPKAKPKVADLDKMIADLDTQIAAIDQRQQEIPGLISDRWDQDTGDLEDEFSKGEARKRAALIRRDRLLQQRQAQLFVEIEPTLRKMSQTILEAYNDQIQAQKELEELRRVVIPDKEREIADFGGKMGQARNALHNFVEQHLADLDRDGLDQVVKLHAQIVDPGKGAHLDALAHLVSDEKNRREKAQKLA